MAVPCAVGATLRLGVLAVAAGFLGQTAGGVDATCVGGKAPPTAVAFMAAALASSAAILVLYVATILASLKGTLGEWKPRNANVSALLHAMILAYIVELGVAVFGAVTWSSIVSSSTCVSTPPSAISTTVALVGAGTVGLMFDLVCAVLAILATLALATSGVFRASTAARPHGAKTLTPEQQEDADAEWLRRRKMASTSLATTTVPPTFVRAWGAVIHTMGKLLGYATCGLLGLFTSTAGPDDAKWRDIATIVGSFMWGLTDNLVLTDLIAALALVRAEQRAKAKAHVAPTSPSTSSPQSQVRHKAVPYSSAVPALLTPKQNRTKGVLSAEWEMLAENNKQGTADADAASATEALDLAITYSPYMIAMYGWKLRVAFFPSMEHFKAAPMAAVRTVCGGDEATTLVETRVFQETVGFDADGANGKLLYSSYTSCMGEAVPYTVSVDHRRRAVVVALRGTLSVEDAFTDLLCTPASLEEAGRAWGFDGSKHFAHSGMLRAALKIRADIETQGILHALLRVDAGGGAADTASKDLVTDDDRETFYKIMGRRAPYAPMFRSEAFAKAKELADLGDCSKYGLVVVGHSLGACMASILSVLLRPRFPTLQCVAYSAVGNIMSLELAEASAAWTLSVCLNHDIFTRLSWSTAKRLRRQLLDALRRCKVSKARAIASLVLDTPASELMFPEGSVPASALEGAAEFRADMERRIARAEVPRKGLVLDEVPLHIPGRVLILPKTHSTVVEDLQERAWVWRLLSRVVGPPRQRHYTAMWIRNRLDFQHADILLNTNMLMDHMPDKLDRVLRAVRREIGEGGGGVVAPAAGKPPRAVDV